MKINFKKIKKSIISNPIPKILAIIFATVLWIFVAASQSSTGKFPSKIQIITVNTPNGLIASYDQKTVELEISAEPSLWQKLSTNSFTTYVDLGGLQVGTYELDVNVTCNVADVQILNKKPAKIFVQLEEIARKKVPVIQKVEGNAAEGMVAGSIVFDPSEIEVSGPKSQIENISNAIAEIRLNGESANFEKDLSLIALDNNGNEISDLSFSPSKVNAKVSIIKGVNNKTVGVKVNLSGGPAEGYYISQLITTPNTVNITGQSSIIGNINFIETQSFDISGISNSFERELLLKIPDGVALQRGEPNRVKISVTLANQSLSRVFSAQIKPKNLDATLRVNSYTPSEVKVTVSGAESTISGLSSSDISLEIDLTGKTAGTFSYDLSSTMFKLPPGVTLVTTVLASLQVVLSLK